MTRIRKVAVLGAGVMGSGIAAHVAGAGLPVLLLDIVPPDLTDAERQDRAARNRIAARGKEKALASKPASFFTPRDAPLVEIGNLEDDLPRLGECDWVVEAVKEDLGVKRALFARIEPHLKPSAIVASNTSGLPLADLTEGRSEAFRKSFLITHFFNPVRYMRLLELVVGPETSPELAAAMQRFAEEKLGKGTVLAKDTPNFIANRIGTFAVFDAIQHMVAMDLSVDEVDAIHGRPLGHPKSAVFRTADIVGLDTLLHVAHNCEQLLAGDEERGVFKPPAFMEEMVKRGLLGEKSGGGFYKKTREGILTLDWKTLEYRPQAKVRYDSLGEARHVEDVGERIKTVVAGTDKAAEFAWRTLSRTLNYSARRLGEIADDVVNVDRAMRWGFNWDLGPFEVLDALGIAAAVERMRKDGLAVAPLLEEMAAAAKRFYPAPKRYWDVRKQEEAAVPVNARALTLPRDDPKAKVFGNDSATLWDVGDDVVALEFHSKLNAVDQDTLTGILRAVDEAERRGVGLVVGNEAPDAFSAGANLFLVLMAARDAQWAQLEEIVHLFQRATMRMRFAEVPVVTAPFGLTLGGGSEIAMHGIALRAHAELYMGQVEAGVGVIPAAGGCKELMLRAMANVPDTVDPFLPISKVFETIAMAKVSVSAENARDLLLLREGDRVSLSREQLLRDAKETVLGLARAGYRPPTPRTIRVPGEAGIANLKVYCWGLAQAHQISEHDLKIATKLAHVLCGGTVAAGARVTEQRILDLEREAFLSLLGEPKTLERMEYMLQHNKPLRN